MVARLYRIALHLTYLWNVFCTAICMLNCQHALLALSLGPATVHPWIWRSREGNPSFFPGQQVWVQRGTLPRH